MTIMGFKKSAKTHDISYWHKKVWKVFSEWIRRSEADIHGICQCVSCGAIHHWKEMDCGHYISRGHKFLLYNETNCNAQCKRCNAFLQGNAAGYRQTLVARHGEAAVKRLEETKNYPAGFTKDGLKLMYEDYKKRLKELK